VAHAGGQGDSRLRIDEEGLGLVGRPIAIGQVYLARVGPFRFVESRQIVDARQVPFLAGYPRWPLDGDHISGVQERRVASYEQNQPVREYLGAGGTLNSPAITKPKATQPPRMPAAHLSLRRPDENAPAVTAAAMENAPMK
jgi:hypothetical protein